MGEVIVLTLPPDPRYATVARIVVGGLAARLDLTYEALDDLQLAVESVLTQEAATVGEAVTLEVSLVDDGVALRIGPLSGGAPMQASGDDGPLDLSTVLAAVVDDVLLEEHDGGHWVHLTKHVPLPGR